MKTCPHCGKPTTRARSLPDHRRLFAVIAAAHAQWPEQHDFQPDDAEHLRAYLTVAAGYRDVTTIQLGEASDDDARELLVAATAAALRAVKAVAFVRAHGTGIAVFTPRSIAWSKLPQHEFAEVRDRIEAVIEREVGATAEQLLQGSEAA